MAIKLNITQRPTATQAAIERGYLYKDIKFDLTPEYLKGNEMYSTRQTKDFACKINKEAVLNSVKNILTTSPGEKLLNPLFGLDLRDYLFEVVYNKYRAFNTGVKSLSAIIERCLKY